MLDNEKKRALKEMEKDLQRIKESLKQQFIEETDSDRFAEISRRIYETMYIKDCLKDICEYFEPLYK